jgi:anti-sigma factor RsiW
MNCNEARQHWMLFLDSEGDPELHLRIREHIGGCPDCAAWFAKQGNVENKINEALSSGQPTPQLWHRVLSHAKVPQAPRRQRRWLALGTAATAAAVLIVLLVFLKLREPSTPTELARNAADWHEQWQRGNVRPELESTSDHEVDRYLKARVPFRVHCPPHTDVQFSVQGAGVCFMKDQRQAAYIVGSVGNSPVSILVLDKSNLDGFPQSGFHHRKEGMYRVASAVIADKTVIVIGTASPEVLERLLNAYGTYHEG